MEKQPSTDDQLLTIINQIIQDNIDNKNFSVEDLVQKLELSRSRLHRKLKKLTGKSARDLITEKRLIIADKLSAAIGKIAILNPNKISYAITINNYYDDLADYENWLNIYKEPLSRIAIWLAKNKEDARNEYPAINDGTIQTANSRTGRSAKTNGRIRDKSDDRRNSQICFDFT